MKKFIITILILAIALILGGRADLAILTGVALILWKVLTMSDAVDRIESEVAEAKSVAQSAIALLGGLSQQIRDNAQDPAKLTALADELDANNAALAAAVVANTPSAAVEGDEED
jgi:hypothetical protein